MNKPVADKYVEMGGAMRQGKMWEDFVVNQPKALGQIKLEDFSREFAGAYNAG
jgi:hypothetical protein